MQQGELAVPRLRLSLCIQLNSVHYQRWSMDIVNHLWIEKRLMHIYIYVDSASFRVYIVANFISFSFSDCATHSPSAPDFFHITRCDWQPCLWLHLWFRWWLSQVLWNQNGQCCKIFVSLLFCVGLWLYKVLVSVEHLVLGVDTDNAKEHVCNVVHHMNGSDFSTHALMHTLWSSRRRI